MSSQQLSRWMAYAHLEPFGEERADWRAALITSMLANIHRDPKRRPKPFSPADFMPHFSVDYGEPQTPDQIYQSLQAWHRALSDPRTKVE